MQETQQDEEDDSTVSKEVLLITVALVLAGAASIVFLGISGAPNGEDPEMADVSIESNAEQSTVAISVVSLGDADYIAVLRLERYDGGNVPYLSQLGEEAVFDFSDAQTEVEGNITAVAVEGDVEESGQMDTAYGSGAKLGNITEDGNRTVVQRYEFDFS